MINKIQIENFKSIRKMDLKLHQINVLIGANGVGKSNFIGFFKLLKNIYEDNLERYVAEEGGADNLLYQGLKVSDSLGCTIQFDYTKTYGLMLLYNHHNDTLTADFEMLKGAKLGRFSNKHLKNLKIFHFHDTSKTAKIKQKGNINDNHFLREQGENLAAYLYFLQEKHPKNFKKIEMTVRSVAPFFGGFNLAPDRINEDYIRLEWTEKGVDKYFNAAHLSDGTLRFMALTTLLLQPEPPKVIIIDEPELGLHPFAISKLAGLIKKASIHTQIIISTQSVNLVDKFSPEDIITVDRKDGQTVFNRHETANLEGWLENYTISDIWEKNIIGGRP
ncbi:MAG: AAA family ATPase [Saprospiraceae bacterium]